MLPKLPDVLFISQSHFPSSLSQNKRKTRAPNPAIHQFTTPTLTTNQFIYKNTSLGVCIHPSHPKVKARFSMDGAGPRATRHSPSTHKCAAPKSPPPLPSMSHIHHTKAIEEDKTYKPTLPPKYQTKIPRLQQRRRKMTVDPQKSVAIENT